MKIGVIVESFREGFVNGAKKASKIGADGIQVFATNGEITTGTMTPSKIKEIRNFLKEEGLVFSALCGDLGCNMFYDVKQFGWMLEEEKKILYLAKELGTDVVTTHIGVVPNDKNCDRYKNMTEACKMLADYADSIGGHFAVETGPEKSEILKGFLDNLQSKGVSVNLDPANLVMCAGDDPIKAVYNLKDYIVHTHAKDGIMLKQTDTRIIYDPDHNGHEPIVCDDYFREVPLGDGGVDFDGYLNALNDIGYKGYLTIEREVGESPEVDIKKAMNFLTEKLTKLNIK